MAATGGVTATGGTATDEPTTTAIAAAGGATGSAIAAGEAAGARCGTPGRSGAPDRDRGCRPMPRAPRGAGVARTRRCDDDIGSRRRRSLRGAGRPAIVAPRFGRSSRSRPTGRGVLLGLHPDEVHLRIEDHGLGIDHVGREHRRVPDDLRIPYRSENRIRRPCPTRRPSRPLSGGPNFFLACSPTA